jgi:RimJ/RimL family protein N-acetyltransferase
MKIPREFLTDRLVLRPVSEEHAKEINAMLDDEVTKYMFIAPEPLEETYKWVERKKEAAKVGNDWTFLIFNNKTNEFLGGGGLHKLNTKSPEFGIWIKKEAWGNGYGSEAVSAVKKWADENLMYDYLVYPVDRKNIPSCKIAEAVGGKVEAEYKMDTPSGKVLDALEYRIYKQ